MKITFTGADDKTNLWDMARLVIAHRNFDIEFGILVGSDLLFNNTTYYGKPRYPTTRWIDSLPTEVFNLSLHLCGQFVKDIFDGKDSISRYIWFHKFKRVQLNLGYRRLHLTLANLKELEQLAFKWRKEIILAGPWTYNVFPATPLSVLIDPSGGTGKKSTFFKPYLPLGSRCKWGIAGGLGPDTIASHIDFIRDNRPDWIDMESNVRNANDLFDCTLCEQVLIQLNGV